MKTVFHIRTPWNLPGLITIGTLLLFMIQSTHANTFEDLQAKLPGQVGRWSAQTDDRVFMRKPVSVTSTALPKFTGPITSSGAFHAAIPP